MKPKTYYVEFLLEGEYKKEYIESRNCDSAVETVKKKYNDIKILKVGKKITKMMNSIEMFNMRLPTMYYKGAAVDEKHIK